VTTTDTTNHFADPTVTDKLASIILNADPVSGCCSGYRVCSVHLAEAIVAAMRAAELVVLTPETADQILAHQRVTVAEEIAVAIEAQAEKVRAESWQPTTGVALAAVVRTGADIARKHREVPHA
jgi:hypothetical protein